MNTTRVFSDKQMLAQHFGRVLLNRTQKSDKVTIALSGGSTPKAIFEELAAEYANEIDWTKVFLFWGDERCVPPTDEESNYLMTKTHLLNKVTIPEVNVFRVKGELNIDAAVEDYQKVLLAELPQSNGLPQFDLMILGMGDDGHTASVFPYQINLWDKPEVCVAAQHPESKQNRVSLTGGVINNAKEIFFLVTGSNKADKLSEILNKKEGYKQYPAALVDKPTWLLDSAAAAKLQE
ncbi:6-phosphogluconolactonase [Saccharicrinis aurantiacus]|uniref:6-phosphogluconolactonase n=1 Tax=Saccharicrinis aurantiacus TaxID=1849719 RepID=UPI000838A192|nr:6-phosphogluconolactonase [Saccharicrinis aurantiacus]